MHYIVALSTILLCTFLYFIQLYNSRSKDVAIDSALPIMLTGVRSNIGFDIFTMAFSLDGKYLSVAGNSNIVLVLDSRNGTVVANLIAADSGPIYAIAFLSSDLFVTASNNGNVTTWNTRDWNAVSSHFTGSRFSSICRINSNNFVLSTTDPQSQISLWQSAPLQESKVLNFNSRGITSHNYSSRKSNGISATFDGFIVSWEFTNNNIYQTSKVYYDKTISSSACASATFFMGDASGNILQYNNDFKITKISSLRLPVDVSSICAIAKDKFILASAGLSFHANGELSLYNLEEQSKRDLLVTNLSPIRVLRYCSVLKRVALGSVDNVVIIVDEHDIID